MQPNTNKLGLNCYKSLVEIKKSLNSHNQNSEIKFSMKKILVTVFASALAFGATAQKTLPAVTPAKVDNIKIDDKHQLKVNSAGGQMSQWFGYALLQEELNNFDANSAFIFPDSNVKVAYVNAGQPASYYNTWFAFGQVFDPKDPEFAFSSEPVETLSKYNNYTIDSLNLLYLYDRKNHTAVDTLIVKVYKTNSGISYWQFTPVTNVFAVVEYDRTNREPAGAANVTEFRIPLTSLDSNANGTVWGEKLIGLTNYNVTRDQEVAVAVSFKPGFTYNNGDTMFATSDVNPQPTNTQFNTFRVRTVDNNANVEHSYYNNGLAVDKTQAYTNRLTGAGFENTPKFLPSNYYGVSQFLDVRFKASSPNVGIKNINANGFGLGEVYPNPASNKGSINVPFAIGKTGEATLKITNVIGQDVITVTDKFNAGENKFEVSINDLKPGVYFYTVNSGNFTATKKITITQ